MKYLILLFLSSTTYGLTYGQQLSVRKSNTSTGLALSVPLNTASKGSLMMAFVKEHDRNLTYFNYVEKIQLKRLSIYGGVGVHLGNRQTLNWKRDANTIFLAGACAVGGVQYSVHNFFIGADIMPRVDVPLFGGCEMHRYCGESSIGSVNFSIGLNLK